ncbi:DnaA N-terminal domain-containing protein, partial [Brevundimonas sp. RM1]
MTDPNRIWTEAADRLKAEIGDGPFSSYIAPSAVRVDSQGNLILVTPTAYARDWVRKNALRRMNELWLGLDGLSRRLEVRCRAEMGSAPPSGLRDAPRLASISPAPAAPAAPAPAFA